MKKNMKITQATPNHATDIAQLVMMAMTDECCLNLAGEGNTLADFVHEMKREVGVDHSGIADETGPGEWYLDSLAVYPQYRGQGIAHLLLQAMVERAQEAGLPAGLLVDKGNPKAERLYHSIGFEYVNDAMWGGHEMRHLQHA